MRTRDTCENRPQLDIRALARKGMVTPGGFHYGKRIGSGGQRGDDDYISVRADFYTAVVNFMQWGEMREQRLDIVRTNCSFGNRRPGRRRPWFKCPQCGKRFAILYGTPFACRKCHRLDYQSQRGPRHSWTGFNRMKLIRKRLGAYPTAAVWQPLPPRPPGMWRDLYARLSLEYAVAQVTQTRMDEPPGQAWRR